VKKQREHSRVAVCRFAYRVGDSGQSIYPEELGGWRREVGEQPLDESVEKIVLVRDMPVQGHRRHTEPLGNRLHGDRFQTLFVGNRESGTENTAPVD